MCRPQKKPKIQSLIQIMSERFDKFNDPRAGVTKIKLSDFLKSAYSIFYFKQPSLLAFESKYQENAVVFQNLKKLLKIDHIPSDTHLRDILDQVN